MQQVKVQAFNAETGQYLWISDLQWQNATHSPQIALI